MIETIETGSPQVLGFGLTGKLHDDDYKQFVPTIEIILTALGKVRLFIRLKDFHGWDIHAAWDEFVFSLVHYSDFERIAIVGDGKWEKWMAGFCKSFTTAKVKYFELSEIDAAWDWLKENDESNKATEEEDQTVKMPTEVNRASPWIWYGL